MTTFSVTAAGGFTAPNGNYWTFRGLNAGVQDALSGIGNVQKDYPGLTAIRLNCIPNNDSTADIAKVVQEYTAAGIVVEIEDHSGNGDNVSWYTQMATTFKDNPLVFLETPNEPTAGAATTAQNQISIIDSIRATGFNNPIGVQPDGGYDQSNIPLVTAALGTTGLYVTPHVYYGGTDPNGAATWVQEQITGAQQNGLFPVIDEFGDALNGYIKDQYGQDVITSVIAANNAGKAGAAFWGMDNNNHQDGADSAFLTPDGSQLTSDGIEIQPWLSQTTGLLTTPVPPVTPSTNDTVILADDTSAITDANGNKWTITNGGQVALNGTVDATTRNVTEMAYVNGKVWQENTDKLWYSKTTPNDTWTPGTSTSPLPPTFTPSPNDTTIQPIPTPTITDNSGNIWAITTGGQVSVNGVVDTRTANVTEMAFVNGKVWQENASKLWYSEATPNGTWTTGTSTSPLPVPQIGPAIGTTGPGPAIQSVLQTNAMSINDFTPAVTTGVNTTGGGSTATTVPEQTIPGIYYSAPTTTSMDNILPTSHSTI